MLGSFDAAANLAVQDLAVAQAFYEGTLGLHRSPPRATSSSSTKRQDGPQRLPVGGSRDQQATAVTWTVGDGIEGVVRASRQRVSASSITTCRDTVRGRHPRGGDMKVAWFKDPDGNILNLASR